MYTPIGEVVSKLKSAIDNKTPYSLIRIGDGEGDVILNSKWASVRLKGWTGVDFSPKQTTDISNQLKDACRSADILGVPSPDMERNQPQYAGSWKRARGAVLDNNLNTGLLTSAYIHYDIDYSILNGCKVRYIASIDLKEKIEEFGGELTSCFHISPDYKRTKRGDFKHYPQQFELIKQWVKDGSGEVTLVAAGGLGKIYCHWIKQAGGIAIDIGSMADSWGNKITRALFKKIQPGNFGGWAIEKPLFDWIKSNFPKGSKIVELGSGTGTIELTKLYNVWSVEHDEKFIGVAPSNYVYAPITGNWYNPECIKGNTPKEFDLLLVDGPPANLCGRMGLLDNLELFDTEATIVCDDINRPKDLELFEKLCAILGREYQILKFNKHVGVIRGKKPLGGKLEPVKVVHKSATKEDEGIVVGVSNEAEAIAAHYFAKSLKGTDGCQIAAFFTGGSEAYLDARGGVFFDFIEQGTPDDKYFNRTLVLSPYSIVNKKLPNTGKIWSGGNQTAYQVGKEYSIISVNPRHKYSMNVYRSFLTPWMAD